MKRPSNNAIPASSNTHPIANSAFRAALGAVVILTGCATPPPGVSDITKTPAASVPPVAMPPAPVASVPPPPPAGAPAPPSAPPATPVARYEKASWNQLPEWDEPQFDAWQAWLRTCAAIRQPILASGYGSTAGNGAVSAAPVPAPASIWQRPCAAVGGISAADPVAQQQYFEANFTPYRLANPDGSTSGLITGYYEPLLSGSRKRTSRFRYPLYAPPADLVTVDLGEVNPDLRDRRVRGRIVPTPQGSKLVPYYARADIVNGTAPVKGLEIAWLEDPVDLFFLQVQGSGRIRLPDGSTMRVGYADHNGHPYRSIGRWLVESGELPADQASMPGIKAWVKKNPERLNELLNQNPAYVFFREVPASPDEGPVGSLGVPLTPGRSIAVDARTVPLGAPVFLATTWPLSTKPLQRLMVAQDTGSAIRGVVRADFFWGFGPEAGEQAGRMKQSGRMWILWPKGAPLPADAGISGGPAQ